MVLRRRFITERRWKMIKAEDLRIGDLVRYEKNIITVQAVHTNYEEGFINDKYNVGYNCHDLDPIPLTPELLEKNGWERDKLVPYIYGHEAHNIEVICTPNSEWVYVTFKGETIHRIKYVHELQHILWALGLDAELKIE